MTKTKQIGAKNFDISRIFDNNSLVKDLNLLIAKFLKQTNIISSKKLVLKNIKEKNRLNLPKYLWLNLARYQE